MGKEREELLERVADTVRTTDEGSVLPKRQILMELKKQWHGLTSIQRDKVFAAHKQEMLSRRDFLKILGVTGAGAVAASAGLTAFYKNYDTITGKQTAGDGGDFQTWKIPAGSGATSIPSQYWDGNTLSNLLIDQSASNAGVKQSLNGKTVKNVGIKGQADVSGNNYTFSIGGGSDVTIKNVYMGDGSAKGMDYMGIWASPSFTAKANIEGCYFGHYSDNGMYLEAAQSIQGSGGTAHINTCFGVNNNISHYRIGNGSTLKNSVAVNAKKIPSHANGGCNSRGLHSFYGAGNDGEVDVENVHIEITSQNSNCSSSAINIRKKSGPSAHTWNVHDSQIKGQISVKPSDKYLITENNGENPETKPPSPVPCTPKEAAGGSS